ncbi:hypothetical protein A3C24_04060 [Candidatus Roizmanbacteria bacterium RIFCSPHIGHO2_02_FULL_37_24]|uniref:Radical SAM core domain-containing protein n=1 Tax=Candidatus Roizmanbacteria bacterium RIFCSPHIGHO2_02_FULL_37_24 TaxID=1802037 RepID=A0A1F7GV45_9BACT|nr:MAG: hypothetical protein A3C24_04060 [Candidatus Roizmanbacteria bacterium RIFCSPHIGHO2_02_FULL_37_24]HLD62026.1 radical SAM protein [Patescibacteria group bacterium]
MHSEKTKKRRVELLKKLQSYSKINSALIKDNLNFFKSFDLFYSKSPKFSKEDIRKIWEKHLADRQKSKSPDSLTLYVHNPFCAQRCNFCCYNSNQYNRQNARRYLDSIFGDCDYFKKTFAAHQFDSVYFGGGTPNILKTGEIDALFSKLFSIFKIKKGAERKIECNPIFSSREKLRIFKKYGFNRISFGVQSLDDKVLNLANRAYQKYEHVKKALRDCRDLGFEDVNIDLMFGLEGDNNDKFLESFDKALSLKPYSLIVYKLIPTKTFYDAFLSASAAPQKFISEPEKLFGRMYDLKIIFKKMAKIARKYGYLFINENMNFQSDNMGIAFRSRASAEKFDAEKISYSFFTNGAHSCFGLGLYSQSHVFGKAFYKDMNQEFDLNMDKKNYTGNTITLNREILFEMAEQIKSAGCVDIKKINSSCNVDFINYFKEAISDLNALNSIEMKNNKMHFIGKRIKVAESLLFFLKPSLLRVFLSVYSSNRLGKF